MLEVIFNKKSNTSWLLIFVIIWNVHSHQLAHSHQLNKQLTTFALIIEVYHFSYRDAAIPPSCHLYKVKSQLCLLFIVVLVIIIRLL